MRITPLIIGIGLASTCFLLSSAGYLLLDTVLENVFGGLFRMLIYHDAHPLQYIAVVSLVFGFVGTFWHRIFGRSVGWTRWVSIGGAIGLTIVMASVPCGILWKIHDMQAGHFPQGTRFWEDLLWGAKEGLRVGWLVMASSIPYNLFGVFLGFLVLHRLPKIVSRMKNQDELARN